MVLSFTQKVLGAIMAMVLLLVGGIMFFFYLKASRIADAEIQRRLNQAQAAFRNYQSEIREKLLAINAYISGNSAFIAYMSEAIDNRDSQSLMDQFEEIRGFSECDFMIVTDADGQPVVDTSDAISKNPDLNIGEFIASFANEETTPIGYLSTPTELFTVVIGPIAIGGMVNGFVLVGYKVDDSTAEEIGGITNCDVLILAGEPGQEAVVADYFEGNSGEKAIYGGELQQILNTTAVYQIFDFEIQDRSYKGMVGTMSNPSGKLAARYVTIKSVARELKPFRDIITGLLVIGGLALLLILPISVLAARSVTRPINQLNEAIARVRDGVYDESWINIKARDEIGQMAKAFKAMLKELREQQELIAYLEKSAQASNPNMSQTIRLSGEVGVQTPSLAGRMLQRTKESGDNLPKGLILGNRYEILEIIGRGGMGVVYRAKDRALDEVVALKMMNMDSPELADILKKETKLARKVTHRNVVRIFDLGEIEGLQFISMEFVLGTTLRALMKRTAKMPLPIGLRIVRQICTGVGSAHEAGIVHGDIKPENVILNSRGEVKVMDFGVAKVVKQETQASSAVVGTPHYMPPEQFRGEPLDARADVYSLGVLMYELFAGVVPFSGATLIELFQSHLNREPTPFKDRNLDLPATLEVIIFKALRKKPEDRYASTHDLLTALETVN